MESDQDDSIIVSFLPLLFLDCDFSYLKLIGLIYLQINLVSKHDVLYTNGDFKQMENCNIVSTLHHLFCHPEQVFAMASQGHFII